jgi:hypothetical protein
MTLQPHQQRVVDEKAELDERREKLDKFLDTETFENLPQHEKTLLVRQSYLMLEYSNILGERIAAFK